jgi:hypothetical protein
MKKWMRYTAFAIGIVSGTLILNSGWFDAPWRWSDPWELAVFVAGPVTQLAASLVGLKFERVAGWWLLGGAVAVATLVMLVLLPWHPGLLTYVGVTAVLSIPMLTSGLLWLLHSRAQGPNGKNLPMMP